MVLITLKNNPLEKIHTSTKQFIQNNNINIDFDDWGVDGSFYLFGDIVVNPTDINVLHEYVTKQRRIIRGGKKTKKTKKQKGGKTSKRKSTKKTKMQKGGKKSKRKSTKRKNRKSKRKSRK